MANQVVGQGPGNLVPDSEKKMFLSGAAFSLGDLVALSGATGYTVVEATATLVPIGIAEKAATAAGEWVPVTVSGYTATTVTTDGNADAGDVLVSAAGGACVAVAPGSLAAGQAEHAVGVALAADSSTSLSGVMVFKKL